MTQYRPTPEEKSQAQDNQTTHNARLFEEIIERVHEEVVRVSDQGEVECNDEDVEKVGDVGVECNDEDVEKDS